MAYPRPLITEDQIQWRIGELAADIRRHYGDDAPLTLVGVLKGSLFFLADLARRLGPQIEIDLAQLSSYGDQKSSSGVVQIRKDLDHTIEGKDVLIVEDIVDSGLTLSHLREVLSTRRPRSLRVVTLLSKPEVRKHHVPLEHVGFEIDNVFVVGYGLDLAERFRNLPYIGVLDE